MVGMAGRLVHRARHVHGNGCDLGQDRDQGVQELRPDRRSPSQESRIWLHWISARAQHGALGRVWGGNPDSTGRPSLLRTAVLGQREVLGPQRRQLRQNTRQPILRGGEHLRPEGCRPLRNEQPSGFQLDQQQRGRDKRRRWGYMRDDEERRGALLGVIIRDVILRPGRQHGGFHG